MDFKIFHDIIMMQFLGNAMDFTDEQMKLLRQKSYARPDIAVAYFEKFKKYLKEMDKRSVQKIPKEILREMFPGEHDRDIYLSGTDTEISGFKLNLF